MQPREGQIREYKGLRSKLECTLTNTYIIQIYKEHRWGSYRYLRTPLKARIRHFFQDLLAKFR